MFADDDVALVGAAVKSIIVAGEREFAPSIGQVKAEMQRIVTKRGGAGGAWERWIQAGKCKDAADELGSVSRLARERGLTWDEAKTLALEAPERGRLEAHK